MLLELKDIHVHYDKVEAVKGISFEVNEVEIVALIGSNGAGKTTTLRVISGLTRPTSGEIFWQGATITAIPPDKIVSLGVAHVPEGGHLFPFMTVLENLMMGAYLRKNKIGIEGDLDRVYQHFPVLRERTRQRAGSLSGGEQRMLSIGRALMSQPRLLLLDEPTLGLSPMLIEETANIIRELNSIGLPMILVEQNAHLALELAHRGLVMEVGRVVLSGEASYLAENENVRKAYLGG